MSETVERGWLIERSTEHGPAYIFVDSNEMLGWTHDSLQAIRFARKEDAEQVARMIDDAEKITEHEWVGRRERNQKGGAE